MLYNAINDAGTTLASPYVAGAGTLALAAAVFPGGSVPFRVTVTDGVHATIFGVTAVAGTTLTLSGSIEGTADVGYAAGSTVECRMTAGALADIHTALAAAIPESQVTGLTADLAAKAALASPALTGSPTAPSPLTADNSTAIATTAWVKGQGYGTGGSASIGGAVSGGTAGSVLFLGASGVLAQDNSSLAYSASTHMLTTAQQTIAYTNTNYTNIAGAGSHLLMTNPSSTGQTVIAAAINGTMVAKWRTDFSGNVNWCSFTGYHAFYTGGDNGTGNAHLVVNSGGTVGVGTWSNPAGTAFNAQFEVDASATGTRGIYVNAVGGATVDVATFAVGSVAKSGVNKTGDVYLTTCTGQPIDAPTAGTVRLDTGGGLWQYVGGAWSKSGGGAVTSVAGRTGAVTLGIADIGTNSATGMIKGNGTALAIATAGTDYLAPSSSLDASKLTGSLPANSISGIIKGNGSILVQAVAGTDYLTPTGNGSGLTSLAAANLTGTVPAGTLPATAVTAGSYTNASLTVGADGRLTAASSGSGGGGSAAGSTGQLQFNNAGAFAGAAALATASGSPLTVTAQAAGDIPVTIKAAATPTGRLLKITDSTPAEQFAIGADFNEYRGGSLFSHRTGTNSVFVGVNCGNTTQTGMQFGSNTAVGCNVMTSMTSAYYNTAMGINALTAITVGSANTAFGRKAGTAITTGSSNVAIGNSALSSCTTGSYNIAIGESSLSAVIGTDSSVAIGTTIFNSMSTGSQCVGIGSGIFQNNNSNTNIGIGSSLMGHELGGSNVAIGTYLGSASTVTNTGAVVIGYQNYFSTAAFNRNYSVSIGYAANQYRAGSYCVAVGYQAGYNDGATAITGDNCTMIGANTNAGSGFTYAIAIGSGATASQSNSCVLGGTTSTNFVDLGVGTATPAAKVHAVADAANKVGLIVQQAASSTVDQVQHRNSSGSPVSGVTKTGDYYLSTTGGTPADAPAVGTVRLDPDAFKLWAYTNSGWKSTTLS